MTGFRALVEETLAALEARLDALDTDALELRRIEGALQITVDDETWVVSQQVPISQLWLAAGPHAWHFLLQEGAWRDRKTGDRLEEVLSKLVSACLHMAVDLG